MGSETIVCKSVSLFTALDNGHLNIHALWIKLQVSLFLNGTLHSYSCLTLPLTCCDDGHLLIYKIAYSVRVRTLYKHPMQQARYSLPRSPNYSQRKLNFFAWLLWGTET